MIFNRLYILLYLIVIFLFCMLCLGELNIALYSSFSHSFGHKLQAPQFMSIKQRLCYSLCVFFIYKILDNMLTVSLRNKIVIVGNESQKLTRQAGNIVLDSGRLQKACFMKVLKYTIPCQSTLSNVMDFYIAFGIAEKAE